ncbi:hypothetical protein B0H14DRAFT_2708816 [Mycena olivaceomarginata]|nr:hypothetical protein B0H14DRAFT_2708816 [Mycena olivaceomarginata]
MHRFVELCVDMRKGRTAKEGLMQYKNIAQNTSVQSIEALITRFVQLAGQKVREAQEKAAVQIAVDVDDLETSKTPESILLGAVSGDQSKDRTDRARVTPWLKFLSKTTPGSRSSTSPRPRKTPRASRAKSSSPPSPPPPQRSSPPSSASPSPPRARPSSPTPSRATSSAAPPRSSRSSTPSSRSSSTRCRTPARRALPERGLQCLREPPKAAPKPPRRSSLPHLSSRTSWAARTAASSPGLPPPHRAKRTRPTPPSSRASPSSCARTSGASRGTCTTPSRPSGLPPLQQRPRTGRA